MPVPEAAGHLDRWLTAGGITHGALFRGITADGRVNPNALDAGQVGGGAMILRSVIT